MFYSVTGIVCPVSTLYAGDMAVGDREATPEEIAAWEISRQPTALDQIRALEQANMDDQRKLNRQAAIDTALTVACRSTGSEGKTRDEVHAIYYASNRGYRAIVDLEAQIAELRKQL